jgi:hypothetical protein
MATSLIRGRECGLRWTASARLQDSRRWNATSTSKLSYAVPTAVLQMRSGAASFRSSRRTTPSNAISTAKRSIPCWLSIWRSSTNSLRAIAAVQATRSKDTLCVRSRRTSGPGSARRASSVAARSLSHPRGLNRAAGPKPFGRVDLARRRGMHCGSATRRSPDGAGSRTGPPPGRSSPQRAHSRLDPLQTRSNSASICCALSAVTSIGGRGFHPAERAREWKTSASPRKSSRRQK